MTAPTKRQIRIELVDKIGPEAFDLIKKNVRRLSQQIRRELKKVKM